MQPIARVLVEDTAYQDQIDNACRLVWSKPGRAWEMNRMGSRTEASAGPIALTWPMR
jgi:hypothetical protein